MVSGPNGELTPGVRDHRTGVTRRLGHVAEPWVAHAGRRRRTVHGHVAGGHATMRVHLAGGHVTLRVHVASRLADGGLTCIVGPG